MKSSQQIKISAAAKMIVNLLCIVECSPTSSRLLFLKSESILTITISTVSRMADCFLLHKATKTLLPFRRGQFRILLSIFIKAEKDWVVCVGIVDSDADSGSLQPTPW